MAAAGGDTLVPTNWPGLIAVTIVVAVIAAATYFGMEMTVGSANGEVETDKSLSVQDVFSSSARREVATADTVRALSRTDFAVPAGSSITSAGPAEDDDMSSDEDAWASSSAEPDEDDAWNDSVETAAATPAATAEPTAAPRATPKPAPTSQPRATPRPAATTAPSSTPAPRNRPNPEELTAWWTPSNNNSGMSVRFAGTLDRGDRVSDGIAVMFSEVVSPAQAQAHMRLRDANGQDIPVRWASGANPVLLFVEGLPEGRYSLSIDGELTGQSTRKLGVSVSGPVFIY